MWRSRRRRDGSLTSSTIQTSSSASRTASVQTTSISGLPPVVSFRGVGDVEAASDHGDSTDFNEGELINDATALAAATRRRVSFVRVRKACSNRVPKGRAILLVLVLFVIERYVFTGAVDDALDVIPALVGSDDVTSGLGYFVRAVLMDSGGRVFYILAGFLADVFLGRYRVIKISLWLYFISFSLLAVGSSLHHKNLEQLTNYIIPVASYLCVIIASAGFQCTIIPFGADQLEAASSSELSSYFYWLYAAFQVGSMFNVVVDGAVSFLQPTTINIGRIIQLLISVALVTLALILHTFLESWYFKNVLRENCIRLVSGVVCFVATVKRKMPQYRRAFRYGEGRVSRIELAKQQYDGVYTSDQVEDVKTFCRISFIMLTFSGVPFAMSAVSLHLLFFALVSLCNIVFSILQGDAMLSYRLNHTLSVALAARPVLAKAVAPNIFTFINTVSIFLTLPLVNNILIPCAPSLRIKEKVGIGMAIAIVAVVSGAYLEWVGADLDPPKKGMLLVITAVLISVQEAFTFVSSKMRIMKLQRRHLEFPQHLYCVKLLS